MAMLSGCGSPLTVPGHGKQKPDPHNALAGLAELASSGFKEETELGKTSLCTCSHAHAEGKYTRDKGKPRS